MSQHTFSNQLIHETSPYLLQHAHNPVNWYPWGAEALSLARLQQKPIILSIGYSACHWCHVMERESFEDEQVAEYMNNHFIAIKVDREERPDLDNLYMQAVQIISGHGGWPLHAFLTPEGKPFYGGTYFPPRAMYQRPSWMDVLFFIQDVWVNKKSEVLNQAETLHTHLHSLSQQYNRKIDPNFKSSETKNWNEPFFKGIRDNLMKKADLECGGFGMAPKFPQLSVLQFLLTYGYFKKDQECLDHVFFSLKSMLFGGIYDHLGGGLCRYSTDEKWLAPHFEKMLYDNALLIELLSDAYKVSKDETFRNAINEIIEFCNREMLHPDGGYYAAIDADSEGEEGKYYVWSRKEISDILNEDATLFCSHYGVSEEGNWEGKNILHLPAPSKKLEEKNNFSESELKIVASCRVKLFNTRMNRIRPSTDDKILSGWNALLLQGLCKAYAALGDESYKKMAVSLFDFLEKNMSENGILSHHNFKNGKKGYKAVAEDYAFFIRACLSMQEITGDDRYLIYARNNTSYMIDHFSQEEGGLFYFSGDYEKSIPVRTTEIADLAIPSPNNIMANNLYYLSVIFDIPEWKKRGEDILINLSKTIENQPIAMGLGAWVLFLQQIGLREIVVTGKNAPELLKSVLFSYLPNCIIQSSTVEKKYPLLKNKDYQNEGLIYVCENFCCTEPLESVAEFYKKIGNN